MASIVGRSERLGRVFDQRQSVARGDLGDSNPMTAISDLLATESFDEIIISTLPSGISRWLGMDLPHRVERRFKLPVTTVTAKG